MNNNGSLQLILNRVNKNFHLCHHFDPFYSQSSTVVFFLLFSYSVLDSSIPSNIMSATQDKFFYNNKVNKKNNDDNYNDNTTQ